MKPLRGIPQVGASGKNSLCVDVISEIFLSMEEKTGGGQSPLYFLTINGGIG
jgi:hypothetical protein